ncbi:hypothetical protein KCU93_g4653, partial [Aureobasidium melanogenum]
MQWPTIFCVPELEASLQFWDEEGFDKCIAAAKNLLEKHDLQANLRMRTLILLAAATLDWDLAEECRLDCETLWHLTRKRFRDHPDEKVHATLQPLRESLDELGKVQEEEALEIEIEEVALSSNGTSDNTAYKDMADARPKSPVFKGNKLARRM